MNRQFAAAHYSTTTFRVDDEGCAGLELRRRVNEKSEVVARVVFWDAEGQFSLEMRVPELPLDIVEEMIREAKDTIQTR